MGLREVKNADLKIMDREFVHSGHVGLPGCGATIAMRFVLKALGEKTIMVLRPAAGR